MWQNSGAEIQKLVKCAKVCVLTSSHWVWKLPSLFCSQVSELTWLYSIMVLVPFLSECVATVVPCTHDLPPAIIEIADKHAGLSRDQSIFIHLIISVLSPSFKCFNCSLRAMSTAFHSPFVKPSTAKTDWITLFCTRYENAALINNEFAASSDWQVSYEL